MRSRAAVLLLMPIALFLWSIGLSLCWIGSKREAKLLKSKLADQKELSVFVPTPEQTYAT